MFNKNKRLERK